MLQRLADRAITAADERAQIAGHVATCARCRSVVRYTTRACDALRAAGAVPRDVVPPSTLLARTVRAARDRWPPMPRS